MAQLPEEMIHTVEEYQLCCGTREDKRVFQGKCHQTDLREIVEYIKSISQSSDSEPPQKRQRFEENVAREVQAVPDHMVVARTGIKILFPGENFHVAEKDAIKRTDLKCHVGLVNAEERRIDVSAYDIDSTRIPLVDVTVDKSAADIEVVEIASRITHFRSKKQEAGRLYVEVGLELHPCDNGTILNITWEIRWEITASLNEHSAHPKEHQLVIDWIMRKYIPGTSLGTDSLPSPQDFYGSLHVPQKDDPLAQALVAENLAATLYPYQKSSVRWMLRRESRDWCPEKKELVNAQRPEPPLVVCGLHAALDINQRKCWLSPIYDLVTLTPNNFVALNKNMSGGLLLEEMGLGKTLEVIALMSLHQRPEGSLQQCMTIDVDSPKESLWPIKATLIITPKSILTQWESEIRRHCPVLTIFRYEGIKSHYEMAERELLDRMANADVVLTTYEVIRKDFHFKANGTWTLLPKGRAPPPTRSKTPLLQFSWWRTVLDEVQMTGSAASNTAKLAMIIPRINAWGVTGTPVKKNVDGLKPLLSFLQYVPYGTDNGCFKALLRRDQAAFRALCGTIAIRHTKQLVNRDVQIPPQRRYVVSLPFTPVEEQWYRGLFEQMCEACGVNTDGSPRMDNWEAYYDEMRSWLLVLRKAALVPYAQAARRRGQPIAGGNGALLTVDELLETMISDAEAELHIKQRKLIGSQITRGKYMISPLHGNNQSMAFEIWEAAYEDATTMVAEYREQFEAAIDARVQRKKAWRKEQPKVALTKDGHAHVFRDLEEAEANINTLSSRLSSLLVVQHAAIYMCGTATFRLRESYNVREQVQLKDTIAQLERKENAYYEQAKVVRKELLEESYERCDKLMNKFSSNLASQQFYGPKMLMDFPEPLRPLGSAVQDAVSDFRYLAEVLDIHMAQIDQWRGEAISLLTIPLVDRNDEENRTGDEFNQAAEDMENLGLYTQILRACIEDRHDILSDGRNELVAHETKTRKRMAVGLETQLLREREDLLPKASRPRSLPQVAAEMRSLIHQFRTRVRADDSCQVGFLEDWLQKTKLATKEQSDAVNALRQECTEFTRLMNLRLEYYRQLQNLSDQVRDWDDEKDGRGRRNVYDAMEQEEEWLTEKIGTLQGKQRFLGHLSNPAELAKQEDSECVICRDEMEVSVMTTCGHFFCEECLTQWHRSHHTCPVCKQRVTMGEIYRITRQPKEAQIRAELPGSRESTAGPGAPKHKSAIYDELHPGVLKRILRTELLGRPRTAKVDMLCKHIIYLRDQDPGAKSLVFSQFPQFLDVLRDAFNCQKIGYSSMDQNGGIEKFRDDPSSEVFLMDAKSQSAGLNLVNASHVFLCEPMINTSLELQAISRVDRIGQKSETTVWLYLVDGTVEENIYEISVRRRMEHVPQAVEDRNGKGCEVDLEDGLKVANSIELQNGNVRGLMAQGKGTGETVAQEDLWVCLFANRHVRDQTRSGCQSQAPVQVADDDSKDVGGYKGALAARPAPRDVLRRASLAQESEAPIVISDEESDEDDDSIVYLPAFSDDEGSVDGSVDGSDGNSDADDDEEADDDDSDYDSGNSNAAIPGHSPRAQSIVLDIHNVGAVIWDEQRRRWHRERAERPLNTE